jgi:hypothetical protein
MLNLEELHRKSSYLAALTKLDAVMKDFLMKLCVGHRTCLHLTDPRIGVVQRVNVQRHARQEERHQPSRVIEVAVGHDDVPDLCELEPSAVQTSSEFKTAASVDQ